MLVSITGTGGASGDRVSGPTSDEIAVTLRDYVRDMGWLGHKAATQMLLADIAKHFSGIRLLATTEIDGYWHADAIVHVQSRGNAPVHLKVQFHLQMRDGSWVIDAARLLQG